ncbi:hypothetical protein NP233_g8864 [Leucocoprinus birnbaumii]|uniref:Uncharacterized protein n=1 Tax=Leucocoprinus birnbaumii TaxID=56174 RepID=A0AAD5YTB8_9AGAR|nr:hypothetical protein NP233_g8864 [Leucocoprinus birnbaumii]
MVGFLGKLFRSSKWNAPDHRDNASSRPPQPNFDATGTPTNKQYSSTHPQPIQPVYEDGALYVDPEDMLMGPQSEETNKYAGHAAGYDNAISLPTRTAGIEHSFLAYGHNNVVEGPRGDQSNTKFTNSFVAKGRQNTIIMSDSPLADQAIAQALARQQQAYNAQQSRTASAPPQNWRSSYYPGLPPQMPNTSAVQQITTQATEAASALFKALVLRQIMWNNMILLLSLD